MKTEYRPAEIEKGNCDVTINKYAASGYNTKDEVMNSLYIDARGERIYISLQEYTIGFNRTTGTSILLTRDEWNAIKQAVIEKGGQL